MQTKKFQAFLLIITIISISIVACGKSTPVKDKNQVSVNPNGDSELAIVMRTMMESGKTMKAEIEGNQKISPYPDDIKLITTAKPTDGMIEDRNIFNGLANYYLQTLDSIYLPAVDSKKQFNHMVKSCVDCHENYCHGPIPAIKKLYIPAQ